MKQSLIYTAAILVTVVGINTIATTPVHAATTTTYPSFIQKLIDTFHLDESKVKTLFDQSKTEKQQAMIKNREDRLEQAVKDGVITEAQKQALLAKMKARIDERQNNRDEMQSWFKEQGIDPVKLAPYMNSGRGMMGGRGMMRGGKNWK